MSWRAVLSGFSLTAASLEVLDPFEDPTFDPTFADPGQPESDRLMAEFRRCKFQLALDALRSELPDHTYVIQG